ncbi:metallophosphoesterase family protein [Thiohalocapsa marina]|uniref:metallophosphoesterase family protein n=1 Tax=Thiohalocapsa marina TaxID=424902 RepID=UPI0036DC073E|nr:hypothetical protein [Sphingobacteriia bacterium]NCD17718.1 hypothetical protein [Actinomycetota bacterium]
MTTFIIGDTHFGHKYMAQDFRGFASVEEHDETLVELWNLRVHSKDTVWVLGDFASNASTVERIAPRLRGHKKLVLGNHDQCGINTYARHFGRIHGVMEERHPGLGRVLLTHVPVHPQEISHGLQFNIHGHIHDRHLNLNGKYLNVNADVLPCRWEPLPWEDLSILQGND